MHQWQLRSCKARCGSTNTETLAKVLQMLGSSGWSCANRCPTSHSCRRCRGDLCRPARASSRKNHCQEEGQGGLLGGMALASLLALAPSSRASSCSVVPWQLGALESRSPRSVAFCCLVSCLRLRCLAGWVKSSSLRFVTMALLCRQSCTAYVPFGASLITRHSVDEPFLKRTQWNVPTL